MISMKEAAEKVIAAKKKGPVAVKREMDSVFDELLSDLKNSITPQTKPSVCQARIQDLGNRWQSLSNKLAPHDIYLFPVSIRKEIVKKEPHIARLMGWIK